MRALLVVVLGLACFSCDKESVTEREVNSMYRNVKRKWQLTSMITTGPLPDSLKADFISGFIDWTGKCKYTDKGGSRQLCGNTGKFNDFEIVYSYGFDPSTGKYMLIVSYRGMGSPEEYETGRKLENLINGKWEFIVKGDIFTAKQITNELLPGVLTTLSAKAI